MKVKIIIIAVLLLTISTIGCIEKQPKNNFPILEKILLDIGGNYISPFMGESKFTDRLIADGQTFENLSYDLLSSEDKGLCHQESYKYWLSHNVNLCNGYALNNFRWVKHSWVVNETTLIETQFPYEKYYGIILREKEIEVFYDLYRGFIE